MRFAFSSLFACLSTLALLSCSGEPDPSAPATPADADTETPASGALSLAAGEVAEVPVGDDGVARVKLGTPSGKEEFVVVLGSTRFVRASTVPYSVSLDPIEGEPPAATVVTGCSLSSGDWSKAPEPTDEPPSGTAPAVGTKRSLIANGETIDAEVYAVSPTAVVWADTTAAHPAKLDKAFVDAFLADWDKVILPRERAVFGMESDLDGDGRIGLVFTPLTYTTAVAYFFGCDLKESLAGCPTGNKGEFLYLTPPDVIAPPYNTPNAMKEILAHELAHLIHFNRKVLRNALVDQPDSGYMSEGLGALAQDVSGYQSGNLYVTLAGLQQIDQFSLTDVFDDRASYDTKRDGPMRGGSYLFARWLYDRGGGDEARADGTIANKGGPAFVRALTDAKESVAAAVATVGKANVADVTMDFYTTLAMSNRDSVGGAAPKNPCFAYLPTAVDPITTKQRGADLFAQFHASKMTGPKLQPATSPTGTMRAGGVELLSVAASAPGELHLSVSADAKAAARVRVARVR